MYPVSEKFLSAIKENSRSFYYAGNILTNNGTEYHFGPEDIVKGSGNISRQVCGNSEIELGSVYAAELSISLFLDADRYTLFDGTLTLDFHLVLEDGEEEIIPMGVFEIAEANRKIKTIEIKAYDYMLRFDSPFNYTASSGTAYEFIAAACAACKVEMAQSEAEIKALPNGKETLGIFVENDIESWRDLLYYVAQALGCVCMIDRTGRLSITPFTMDPVFAIDTKERFSSSYSDFETRYTAISSTNRMKEISEYVALEVDDGLTMNLGVNPLLQYGVDATRARVLNALLGAVSSFSYVPFESTTIGNPALDPMDVLVFTGGHADESKLSLITQISYRINGKQTLKCVGRNPKLQKAKSKNDKNIINLVNQIDATKTVVYQFMNVEVLKLTSEPVKVIGLSFTSKERTSAMFLGELLLSVEAVSVDETLSGKASYKDSAGKEVESDVTFSFTQKSHPKLTVTYRINDAEITSFIPEETLHEGKKILTLYYPIDSVPENRANTFDVYLSISDGTAKIEEMNALASIMGQGLVADYTSWDGNIKVEETFVPLCFLGERLSYEAFKTRADISTTTPTPASIRQPVSSLRFSFDPVGIESFNERINFDFVIKSFTMDATYPGQMQSHFIEVVNGAFKLAKDYSFKSEDAQINIGVLKKLDVVTSDLMSTESIEVSDDS